MLLLKQTIPLLFSITLSLNNSSFADAAFNIDHDPECPCLDESVHNETKRIEGNNGCLDTTPISLNRETNIQEAFCYPEHYGVGCETHDVDLDPNCKGEADDPSYCSQSWCYIDPDKCHSSANNTFSRSVLYSHLFYSYDTCGSDDTFRDFAIASALEGQTLKIGIPALLYPDHYREDENGEPIFWSTNINDGSGELKGMYIDYMKQIASDGNFAVEYRPVSASATQVVTDPYTACVFDVGRGILDMCAGTFWETTERSSVVPFSTALSNEVYYLALMKPKVKDDVFTHTRMLFKPFTTNLWLVIIAVTFLVGIVYKVLGPDMKTSDSTSFHVYDLMTDIYYAWMELVQGADEIKEKTISQRGLVLAWSFFILIIIAAYTANLAAFLGTDTFNFDVVDIDGCLRSDCLVCHTASRLLDESMQKSYPTLRRNGTYDDPNTLITDLENGKCDTLLLSNFQWKLNADWWKNCEIIKTEEIVTFFKIGWPVVSNFAQTISFFISRSLDNDSFERAFDVYAPPEKCAKPLEKSQEEPTPQITVAAMAGPLIFLLWGMIFGLLVKFGNRCCRIIAKVEDKHDAEEGQVSSSNKKEEKLDQKVNPYSTYIR